MSMTFSVTISVKPKKLLDRAKIVAGKHGAKLAGDEQKGTFSGKGVEGKYTVMRNEVVITVTKKPFYALWSIVKEKVSEFFSSRAA